MFPSVYSVFLAGLMATQIKDTFPISLWLSFGQSNENECVMWKLLKTFQIFLASFLCLFFFFSFLPPSCCVDCECDNRSLSFHFGPRDQGHTLGIMNYVQEGAWVSEGLRNRAVLNLHCPDLYANDSELRSSLAFAIFSLCYSQPNLILTDISAKPKS